MVQLMTQVRRLAWLAFAALALAGCARQPDAEFVRQAVQQQLDAALGGRVLQIEQFRRAGSQPLGAGDGRLVYFNAQLKLASSYDFTQWGAHSVATLASLLGAGPKGILGIKAAGNQAGDLLGVYGSAAFVSEGGKNWQLLSTAPPKELDQTELPAAAGASVRLRAKEIPQPTAAEVALERLASLLNTNAGPTLAATQRDAIVTQELDAAYRIALARLTRAADTIALAGGPEGGAYAEVAHVLAERAQKAGVHFEALTSEGSVGNIRQLSDGRAQFALVQNDIAAAAFAGRGRFGGAAQPELRAVASLFPEAIQLVVRAGSPIGSVADLTGMRVDLGLEGSGTRANALAILAANGIAADTLGGSSASGVADAAALLAAGRIDAMFATVHAPARALQAVAARTRLAWIDLLPTDALRESGLVPLKLPARTYAGQAEPVQTLAATALMITRADVPAQQVDSMLMLLFEAGGGARLEGSAAAQIGRRTAREGVVIPWAPAAEQFLPKAAAATAPVR
jgi:TRAP transporter TAXI family solute receptor